MSTTSTNQSTISSESKHVSCSLSLREPKISHTKKRIGPYSFYLNDCIGNGYSSQVYRGYKNGNKQIMYAIKVIRMGTLSKGRYQLLQNQIAILRQLDHPHIIRLHDVFYTQNNCYIITDFCEGGTLQNCIESEVDIDWVIVFNQLLQACSYLEKKLIIHRDLKPANIFFKQNQWKIGDFGFARYIPYKSAEIKQTYQVGSPLFMPPQTLQKNIYSLKTDSFAFGILFYHLITRKFPWSGNSKKQLLQSYSSKPYPIQNINNIGVLFQKFLNRLCQVQISQRLYITDFYYLKGIDSGFSQTTQASLLQIPQEQLTLDFLQELNLDMTQRLKLCRFLFYIDANIQHLTEMVVISQHIRQFLMMLMSLFGQLGNQNWLKQFGICQNYKQLTSIQQLKGFVSQLTISIDNLKGTQIKRCQILRFKLIQLLEIVDCLLSREFESLKMSLHKIILHTDFLMATFTEDQIQQIQNILKY